MGLNIYLYVNFRGIEPEQWESAYQESVKLLNHFPVPLMRLAKENKHGHDCNVFTTEIFCEVGSGREHWRFCGDMTSYRYAESFQMYRHLDIVRGKNNGSKKDVLWAQEDGIHYLEGNGSIIFNEKTQGYPYHLAVLAVAILFESRFPENCYLNGDVDREQVEYICRWCNKILNTPVTLPVCMDGAKLYQRLSKIYADKPILVIYRFETLFRGTEIEVLKTLLEHADKNLVFEKFEKDLAEYESLSQLGAINLINQFICTTQDLPKLIQIILRIAEGDKKDNFTLENLLSIVCKRYLTIPLEERLSHKFPISSPGHLKNIEETFIRTFMMTIGASSEIECYIESKELLEHFSSFDSTQTAKFQKIINEHESKCRTEIATIVQMLHDLESNIKNIDAEQMESLGAKTKADRHTGGETEDTETAYILKQVSSQQYHFQNIEKIVSEIGRKLDKLISKNAEVFCSDVPEYYQRKIAWASYKNGFAISELSWKKIDLLKDTDMLRYLSALCMVIENNDQFWNARMHIMEHPHLWQYLGIRSE